MRNAIFLVLVFISACQRQESSLQRYTDIPKYDNIVKISKDEDNILNFSTSDSYLIVREFYDNELKKSGWIFRNETNKGLEYGRLDSVIDNVSYGRNIYINIQSCNSNQTCISISLQSYSGIEFR